MSHAAALISLTLLSAAPALAYETDDITAWSTPPADGAAAINGFFNEVIDGALREENNSAGCTSSTVSGYTSAEIPSLIRRIHDRMNNNPLSYTEMFIASGMDSSLRTWPEYSSSIYADVPFSAAPVLITTRIAPVLRIADNMVGMDKFGHFISQGYEYFERLYAGYTPTEIMSYGTEMERGIYGMATTGIYSYADLSANYAGMNFYSDLLFGPSPLIACIDGMWARTRSFDITRYVTAAWDESTNCSEYNAGTGAAVRATLSARGVSCPLRPTRCSEIMGSPCGESVISPACRSGANAGRDLAACPERPTWLPSPASSDDIPRHFRRCVVPDGMVIGPMINDAYTGLNRLYTDFFQ